MKQKFLLGSLLIMTCAVQAQLYHNTPASLQDHMREVNAQWHVQGHLAPDADRTVTFNNDAERIAMHLHLVRETLGERSPEGLAAEQAMRRSELLERLSIYADGGVFPQNYVLPYRNPIFIDPLGTACAVGHLMIESGNVDLAERISVEMNNAYVLGMEWKEIGEWAGEHGFSPAELAWIQPGYLPTHPWATVGDGTNGNVNVLLPLDNGDLLVAGEFTEAGGDNIVNVAVWNGATYTALGGGLNGEITCAVQHGSNIYIGGSFLGNGIADLARWDGSDWTYFTIFEGKLPLINALHVHVGDIYAAGGSMGFAGVDDMVRLVANDGTYTTVGSVLNERILAMTTYMGFLVIGGEFTGLDYGTDPLIDHLAVLEGGEWAQLANGTDAPVRALHVEGDELYVGGDLFVNGTATFGLARLVAMGPTLELLDPHDGAYFDPEVVPSHINALQMHTDGLYFGGRFFASTFTVMGNNLGLYDLGTGAVEPMIWVGDDVHAMVLLANRLYAGGAFAIPYQHITVLDLSTDIADRAATSLGVFPNPATDQVMIDLGELSLAKEIEVYDNTGRIVVVPMTRNGRMVQLNVSALSSGTYTVRIGQDGGSATGRFVRE